MEKEKYIACELEILLFENEDIITTSNECPAELPIDF